MLYVPTVVRRTGDSGTVGAAFPLAGEVWCRCLMGALHYTAQAGQHVQVRCGDVHTGTGGKAMNGHFNTGGMFTRLPCINAT